jgi:hypothetical protein
MNEYVKSVENLLSLEPTMADFAPHYADYTIGELCPWNKIYLLVKTAVSERFSLKFLAKI